MSHKVNLFYKIILLFKIYKMNSSNHYSGSEVGHTNSDFERHKEMGVYSYEKHARRVDINKDKHLLEVQVETEKIDLVYCFWHNIWISLQSGELWDLARFGEHRPDANLRFQPQKPLFLSKRWLNLSRRTIRVLVDFGLCLDFLKICFGSFLVSLIRHEAPGNQFEQQLAWKDSLVIKLARLLWWVWFYFVLNCTIWAS